MKYVKKILIYLLAILVILQCYSLLSMIVPNRYFYISINLLLIFLIFCELKIKRNLRIEMLIIGYLSLVTLLFTSGFYRNFEFVLSIYLPFPLFLIFIMQFVGILYYRRIFEKKCFKVGLQYEKNRYYYISFCV